MEAVTIDAPAKINLYLEVLCRRENGYHDLESVMQSVSLYDTLVCRHIRHDGIIIDCSDMKIAALEQNLITRAADVFFHAAGISGDRDRGIHIHLEKRIPIAAGLAGGSTDAAATLIALNSLYETGYNIDFLCEIGAKIGADVPFCIKKGCLAAYGIGERLCPCPPLPSDCTVVIAIGNSGVSTKWAFEKLDEISAQDGRKIRGMEPFLAALGNGNLKEISEKLYNVFELVSPYDANIKAIMLESGALGALMSGSGSSVFGIFSSQREAKIAYDRLCKHNYYAFVCGAV